MEEASSQGAEPESFLWRWRAIVLGPAFIDVEQFPTRSISTIRIDIVASHGTNPSESLIGDHAPLFFMLWGIPFILADTCITVGRFVSKRMAQLVVNLASARPSLAVDLCESIPLRGKGSRSRASSKAARTLS